MRKSFSLLEIIFTITIIAVVTTIAIPKLFFNVNTATTTKLKADIALIRNGINSYKEKQIISNTTISLDSLDTNNNLFSKILKFPIMAQENKSGSWSKISLNNYKAWIVSDEYVEFVYSPNDFSFNCNIDEDYCEQLSQ